MSHNQRHTRTLRNRAPRRAPEFSEHSLPRQGSVRTLGLETNQHSLLSSCPARDCVCSIPTRSPRHLHYPSERNSSYSSTQDKCYQVSRCGSQVSVLSYQISRAPSCDSNQSAQFQTHQEYGQKQELGLCRVHGTPRQDRRTHHRDFEQGHYSQVNCKENDVSSMISEIEKLSLYSSSSRKQSLASTYEDQQEVKKKA